jgi:hypothetical protein
MDVVRVPTDVTAAERARWLGELTRALEEAQGIVWRLKSSDLRQIDALDLLARIESAQAEARSLRLSRVVAVEPPSYPDWINPWETQRLGRCA